MLKDIPDGDNDECTDKTVDDRVTENRIGNDTIPEAVFRSNTDKLAENSFPRPDTLCLIVLVQIVLAAMEHTVKIERFFAGQLGNDQIDDQAQQRDESIKELLFLPCEP